ncbi:hypothetical protein A2U01_0085578, partial [Trifolium medium]|nr:hypothetical protein [Trifolium medium]
KGLVVKGKVLACLKPEDKVEEAMVVRVMAALGSKVLHIVGLETVEVTAVLTALKLCEGLLDPVPKPPLCEDPSLLGELEL